MPHGFDGEFQTIATVRGVIAAASWSGEMRKPRSTAPGISTQRAPASSMSDLYETHAGVGSRTSSPRPGSTIACSAM